MISCEDICWLVGQIILILIVVIAYRYYMDRVNPLMKKAGFMSSPGGGCGSCNYLAKPLDVTKTT